jgi:hypothetical protein
MEWLGIVGILLLMFVISTFTRPEPTICNNLACDICRHRPKEIR